MGKSLFQKVWESHRVGTLADGRTQLFIGTHLIHEVTSPQAFGMLRDLGLQVKFPQRTFATVDHIVPTVDQDAPQDPLAVAMMTALRENVDDFGITYFDLASGKSQVLKYDRTLLDKEIKAQVKAALLFKYLPKSIVRRFYPEDYFPAERFPDWK